MCHYFNLSKTKRKTRSRRFSFTHQRAQKLWGSEGVDPTVRRLSPAAATQPEKSGRKTCSWNNQHKSSASQLRVKNFKSTEAAAWIEAKLLTKDAKRETSILKRFEIECYKYMENVQNQNTILVKMLLKRIQQSKNQKKKTIVLWIWMNIWDSI